MTNKKNNKKKKMHPLNMRIVKFSASSLPFSMHFSVSFHWTLSWLFPILPSFRCIPYPHSRHNNRSIINVHGRPKTTHLWYCLQWLDNSQTLISTHRSAHSCTLSPAGFAELHTRRDTFLPRPSSSPPLFLSSSPPLLAFSTSAA